MQGEIGNPGATTLTCGGCGWQGKMAQTAQKASMEMVEGQPFVKTFLACPMCGGVKFRRESILVKSNNGKTKLGGGE